MQEHKEEVVEEEKHSEPSSILNVESSGRNDPQAVEYNWIDSLISSHLVHLAAEARWHKYECTLYTVTSTLRHIYIQMQLQLLYSSYVHILFERHDDGIGMNPI